MNKALPKCPTCDQDGAYIGANSVECPNTKCAHFTQRQLDEWNSIRDTVPAEHDYHPPQRPMWIWSNHHHDFGDTDD